MDSWKSACKPIVAALVFVAMTAAPWAMAGKPGESPGRSRTSVERLAPERLAAAHHDVERHRASRRDVPDFDGLHDFRAVLHAHADDSAHTGGTREEMLADAKKAEVDVIMLTDHFRPPRDFMDSWRGLRDGVLFIPGSEAKGFLLYPDDSIMDAMEGPAEQLISETAKGSGLIFLSHVEERMDHPMDGLTGMEIYNRHADAKDDPEVLYSLALWATDPQAVTTFQQSLAEYPEEVLAAQLDYPADYLAKWDRETQTRPLTGVAANDCHHNQVFIVKMVDDRTVRIGTIVDDDDEMRILTADMRPGIPELTKGHQPGDVLVKLDLDPYARMFHNVSTHILAPELTEPAVREALAQGHAYVSHDWMVDPTGFRFFAVEKELSGGEARGSAAIMGDAVAYRESLTLAAEFPAACDMRLVKNGEVVDESSGNRLSYRPSGPGVYRVEGWLPVDGEDRVWIYSNPIYLR